MGTLFRIFPQTQTGIDSMPAEVVEVSTPAGSVGPGPSDDQMYVINPIDKPQEYGMHEDARGHPYVYLPPWDGPIYAPAMPDTDGHFLHYHDVNDHRFHAAHAYASIRFTLDVWESYYGQRIDWYFKRFYSQAEVVVLPDFENAQIGRGFVEIGTDVSKVDGSLSPFTLNFDVIAHEVGHGILFTIVGEPDPARETAEFLGFQESSGDVVSMIAILHFDSVIDEVLDSTSGNLYRVNHLNRFAETSAIDQIRMASNSARLSDFSAGWNSAHLLAQPLTGAIFDIFVDIFHEELVRVGAISTRLEQISDQLEGSAEYETILQVEFDQAYALAPELFRDSLVFARDVMATLLVDTWAGLSPDNLHYIDFLEALFFADQQGFAGRYRSIIDSNFAWRHIGSATVGPRLPKDSSHSHSHGHGHGHGHGSQGNSDEQSDKPADGPSPGSRSAKQEAQVGKSLPRSYAQRYRDARGITSDGPAVSRLYF